MNHKGKQCIIRADRAGVFYGTLAEKSGNEVTRPLHRALFDVRDYARVHTPQDVTVYVEDARLRTWIPREKSMAEFKGRAQGAGSVKRDASVWEDFCEDYGIRLVKVPPKYNATKLSADVFARITGYKGRTSEHARDAAMLVFGK